MDLNELKHQSVDGIPRISYKELGNGPPVIFLHGIGGNHSNWYDQQSYISDNFTTIACDARGYGDSDDYNGPLNFSDFGEDLIRLLDARNISKAHFVGLSMGARILMDFFPKHRSRVATLILCDCFFDYKILSDAITPNSCRVALFVRIKAAKPEAVVTLVSKVILPIF